MFVQSYQIFNNVIKMQAQTCYLYSVEKVTLEM